jgi:hypothetical protein
MACVPGRSKAVRPLLSVGARLIAFGRFAPASGQGDRGGIHGSRLVLQALRDLGEVFKALKASKETGKQ